MPGSVCRFCKVDIHWCLTAGKNARGTRVPLDVSSDSDRGHVRKTRVGNKAQGFVTYAENLEDAELDAAVADGELLYQYHSETCSSKKRPNPKPAGLTLDLPKRPARPGRRYSG